MAGDGRRSLLRPWQGRRPCDDDVPFLPLAAYFFATDTDVALRFGAASPPDLLAILVALALDAAAEERASPGALAVVRFLRCAPGLAIVSVSALFLAQQKFSALVPDGRASTQMRTNADHSLNRAIE